MENYQGYLIKIEGRILPNTYIALDKYTITPNQRQDEDSYQDSYGELQRNILPHRRTKAEFETIRMWEEQMNDFLSYLPDQPELAAEYWNPRTAAYDQGRIYTPDIEFTIYSVADDRIKYNPIRIALIEY